MGGSIMAAVLRHPDCPIELLQSALASERAHLQRIATKRLHRYDRNGYNALHRTALGGGGLPEAHACCRPERSMSWER